MKKISLVLILFLLFFSSLLQAASGVSKDCSFKGRSLKGKVQIVNSFPDIKVQVVSYFPDLKVKQVSVFPDHCGEWQFVTSFADFKIQFVNYFPDLKIQFVDYFPGLP